MGITITIQLIYLLRIFVAALCGGIIGYERESRMKTAGVRTHLIVSMASSLMMILSKYGFYDVLTHSGIGLDPSRIAAGVVTAIGFLGAGVIFVRKQNISGITTAAGIWATVGVGMAIGSGLYLIGITSAIFITVVQVMLHRKSKLIKEPISGFITLQIENEENIKQLFSEIFASRQIEITNFRAKKLDAANLEIKIYVRYPELFEAYDIVQLLKTVPSIKCIET